MEDGSDLKGTRAKDEGEREADDKRKHRSSKSRKSMSGEEAEGFDWVEESEAVGRKTGRKRSGGSSRAGSDEDKYEEPKESRTKQMKKKQEETALETLSNWYQDGEADNKHGVREKSGSRGHENASKKSTSKLSDRESKSKGKEERSHEGEHEKPPENVTKFSERKEGGREKEGRNQRKRWYESDSVHKVEENHSEIPDSRTGKSFDLKREDSRLENLPNKIDPTQSNSRDLDLNDDVSMTSHNKDEKGVEFKKSKSKGSTNPPEEGDDKSPAAHERMPENERLEDKGCQRNPASHDIVDGRENSFNDGEDGYTMMRDKYGREMDTSNISRTPERNKRHHQDSEYRDDRLKTRDDSWNEKNRDREGSRDNWKRRQHSISDEEAKEGDSFYDNNRDWEVQRRGRDRPDSERPLGRSGRKDGNRTEAVKTSSNYGISNENYDVIEIQTRSFGSTFARKNDVNLQLDVRSGSNDDEYSFQLENSSRNADEYKNDSKERYMDEGDSQSGKGRGQRGVISNRSVGGQTSSRNSQPLYVSQESVSFNKGIPQGVRGNNRMGRGGRGRLNGRESQQPGIPLPIVGSPFTPLGMPPHGTLQPLPPTMSPVPPILPGVFIPPFSPPVVWPGGRGVDMNIFAVPTGLSPVPPGPVGPRFAPSMGTPPGPAMYFNQQGPGIGPSSNAPGPSFTPMFPVGRSQALEKSSWVPPRTSGPASRAPSRGEQNDYSQNFVDTGMRPQNFIRELELTSVVEDYPKLRELIQKKDEIVAKSASAPMYYKCDLKEFVLSPEFFGAKFDVILIDPPWEEYVHRAPGVTDHMEYWTFEEIMDLKIEAIADTPSFIFLWVGDGVGLEQGRQCLKKWGFRRCEDICWVKTNKTNATPGLRHDSHTLFQRSKEHCLMGIKGTVRRSTDGHIIHANIDTDVIIAEEPPYGSTAKPEDMYRIVEHFSLGRRRLELFGEDHNIRSGWLTVGKDLSSSNFNVEAYIRNFADKDGKVWQGGGGRNPPPEAGHLVLTTPDIEALRPKSPLKNQQQQQQSNSVSISLTNNSGNKRATANSPSSHSAPGMNQEASSSNMHAPVPWGSSEGLNVGAEERGFDVYGYNNMPFGQVSGEYLDFDPHRGVSLL